MDTAVENVRKSGKEKPFLPSEIIRNILISLPVKSLVRFELVCLNWRDMILARDFVDLHQRSSIPLILVATKDSYDFNSCYQCVLFALDKWWDLARWDLARTRSMILRFPFRASDFPNAFPQQFSHSGLIVLRKSAKRKFIILNPARPSDDCVKIKFSRFFKGGICAVYYHPSLKEYCTLWQIVKFVDRQQESIEYRLLNLGSNPSLKKIFDPFTYRVKDTNAYPLFINSHLYWMLISEQDYKFGGRNDILEFDIMTEEFMVIPCPVPLNTECMSHQTHLLNSDGILSFVLILPSTITIWTLEDHVQQLWTTIEYTISLDIFHEVYAVRIIAFFDGKLAFQYQRRLFVCNLRDGTVKKYPEKNYGVLRQVFLSHQMSLASLKNCKSALYISKEGEVVV